MTMCVCIFRLVMSRNVPFSRIFANIFTFCDTKMMLQILLFAKTSYFTSFPRKTYLFHLYTIVEANLKMLSSPGQNMRTQKSVSPLIPSTTQIGSFHPIVTTNHSDDIENTRREREKNIAKSHILYSTVILSEGVWNFVCGDTGLYPEKKNYFV